MNKKLLLYHFIAWGIFCSYELLTVYIVAGKMAPSMDYITHYALNAVLFYANGYLITKYKASVKLGLFILVEILIYMGVNYMLNATLMWFGIRLNRPLHPLYAFLIASSWRCVYFLGLSTVYGFALNLIQARDRVNALLTEQLRKEKNQVILEKDLLTTQNALLRAQINPHLFFNTLNFIYNSIHKVSANAGEAVMLLADITRYSISKGEGDGLVFLKDELVNINDLIALNQIRFDDKLQIRFDVEGNFKTFKIIPLVLLTLVENVFKYGDLQSEDEPALIHLRIVEDIIHFSTRNKKMPENKDNSRDGIGLSNAKFRLQQAYPEQFKLRINETEQLFFVDLSITLESLCAVVTS